MVDVGFSPCPNDTFIFYGWVSGNSHPSLPITPHYQDVQTLNTNAEKGTYPVTKLSCYAYGKVAKDYIFLPVGAALGKGCGPLVIAKEPFDISELKKKRLVIPGKETTANLLAKSLLPAPQETFYCFYDEVLGYLDSGKADAGVIIHETRFTYQQLGYHLIADLGALWEKKTEYPLPLGGIAAKRSLGEEILLQITQTLSASCAYTGSHLDEAMPYILENSIEKDPEVVKAHIDLYVNAFTYNLGEEGERAFKTLLEMGGFTLPEHTVFSWKPSYSQL